MAHPLPSPANGPIPVQDLGQIRRNTVRRLDLVNDLDKRDDMARSILHQPRTEKHKRLFELIRQGRMAAKTSSRPAASLAPAQAKALRDKAAASLSPQA